jgi:hypothetical protein
MGPNTRLMGYTGNGGDQSVLAACGGTIQRIARGLLIGEDGSVRLSSRALSKTHIHQVICIGP